MIREFNERITEQFGETLHNSTKQLEGWSIGKKTIELNSMNYEYYMRMQLGLNKPISHYKLSSNLASIGEYGNIGQTVDGFATQNEELGQRQRHLRKCVKCGKCLSVIEENLQTITSGMRDY